MDFLWSTRKSSFAISLTLARIIVEQHVLRVRFEGLFDFGVLQTVLTSLRPPS
jgi:hypothetical protein